MSDVRNGSGMPFLAVDDGLSGSPSCLRHGKVRCSFETGQLDRRIVSPTDDRRLHETVSTGLGGNGQQPLRSSRRILPTVGLDWAQSTRSLGSRAAFRTCGASRVLERPLCNVQRTSSQRICQRPQSASTVTGSPKLDDSSQSEADVSATLADRLFQTQSGHLRRHGCQSDYAESNKTP